jgi:hypothetical protein
MPKLGKALLCACCIFSLGCVRPLATDNYYVIEGFQIYNVRDVGVLPFRSKLNECDSQILENIRQIFVSELRRRNQYRAHVLEPSDLDDLERMAQIDAVVSAEVYYYHTVEPFKFGLSVQMRDLDTGQVVWSASHIFDASLKEVVDGLQGYYQQTLYAHQPLLGKRAILWNINKFIAFSCSTLLDTLEDATTQADRERVRERKKALAELRSHTRKRTEISSGDEQEVENKDESASPRGSLQDLYSGE